MGASLGTFGEPDPKLDAAIARIAEACKAAAMPLGIDLVDLALLPGFRAQGISLFSYGADVTYLAEGAGAAAAELHAALGEG